MTAFASPTLVARRSLLRRLDLPLLLSTVALTGMGTLLVWSATRTVGEGGDPHSVLKRHLLNIGIGVLLAWGAALVDHRLLRTLAPVVYLASIAGLLAVLSPLGSRINGSRSWIVLPGGFSVQPAEFAKVALVVGLAMLLAEGRDGELFPRDRDIAVALILAGIPLGLVMLQPDLGTSLVLCTLLFGVIVVAGAPMRWIAGLIAGGALTAAAVLKLGLLEGYQLDRFTCFLDPGAGDEQGACWTVQQARIAIGSGGVEGQGLFGGHQTQGGFVPEQQTDFIFTVAGEELGLLGAGLIVLLFAILLWRAARIAAAATDAFGRLAAAGVMSWFAFQAFENIGMTLGLMPVTGIPLPFVSYGGSSMFASMIAVGLLQNVHLSRGR